MERCSKVHLGAVATPVCAILWCFSLAAAGLQEVPPLSHEDHAQDTQSVLEHLAMQPRSLPMQFLYDAKGSDLFEKITTEPEYYLTRTEAQLIDDNIKELSAWGRDHHLLVELGAGVGEKTHRLLPSMHESAGDGFLYVPIDISTSALEKNEATLRQTHPDIEVHGIAKSFLDGLSEAMGLPGQKTILFLGSTLGNFKGDDDARFVCDVANYMSPGDRFIIGVDTAPHDQKPLSAVVDAYRNSSHGYCNDFVRNMLVNIDRRIGTDFDLGQWRRNAEWSAQESAVMHFFEALEAQDVHQIQQQRKQGSAHSVRLAHFDVGDRVFISTHRKYTEGMVNRIAKRCGMAVSRSFKAKDGWFLLSELILSSGLEG